MNKFLVLICFVCVTFFNLAQLDDAKKEIKNKDKAIEVLDKKLGKKEKTK